MNITPTTLRQISSQDFVAFGVNDLAYIKVVDVDGSTGYAIHAADGTPLTVMPEREAAFAAVRQHELEPVSVH
ncbi:hypothetical protein N825_15125 [Skermanella stibiiresistens SB22]|uniref:DUF1150 family protein n=1 Tax=Skermanella stibiiresistens SB22 TaxID=1385369 RepID=W9GVQ6_9PROT|nr:DUF1150 family protein [Skermanella stibiiresistens]EWY37985.1 hypothetical protein N825_15125 [Skermanella stibiiresistens SB22]